MKIAKDLKIIRNRYVTGKRVFGYLYVKGRKNLLAYTMEPRHDLALAEVSGSDTAIKAGRYRYTVERHPKLGMVLRYHDTPGRYGALMHRGNYDRDTEGCTLPGLAMDAVSVSDSRKAMQRILEAVTGHALPDDQVGYSGWIEIIDGEESAKSG